MTRDTLITRLLPISQNSLEQSTQSNQELFQIGTRKCDDITQFHQYYNFIYYQASMLKLQNFQIQLSKRILTQPTNKFLRISVGNIVKVTSQPAKFINEQSMEWMESLSFPLLYNKQFLFEIYHGHQFGYHPDQFRDIMHGKMVIDNVMDTKGTWEIHGGDGQPLGYLSAEIVSKVPAMLKNILKQSSSPKKANPEQLSSNQQKAQQSSHKTLKIKSIVSRLPNALLKKAYIIVQVGQQISKTQQMRSRAGELVCIEQRNVPLQQNDTDAQIKICSLKAEGDQEVVHAEGTLQLIGEKPSKKIILMKDGHEVGQAYIQCKIIDRNQMLNNSSMISNGPNPNTSRVSINNNQNEFSVANQTKQQYSGHLRPRPKSISPSKSIDFTRLEHFGIDSSRLSRPTMFDSSIFSSPSSKRRSVVHQNNNIVFPKQRRFMMYQDKQNQRVSYLVDRSFQFVESKAGDRYRGASIGYGEKVDFAKGKRQNPGVGNYKLPSIWDRY